MSIFFYKGLTRNPEMGNTHVLVRDTKFGANASNETLLNDAKCQGYTFHRFWVIKEKPTGGRRGGGRITPPRLG